MKIQPISDFEAVDILEVMQEERREDHGGKQINYGTHPEMGKIAIMTDGCLPWFLIRE
jgi:hypothetical protein